MKINFNSFNNFKKDVRKKNFDTSNRENLIYIQEDLKKGINEIGNLRKKSGQPV